MNNWKDSPHIKNALSIIIAGIVLITVYFTFLNFSFVKSVISQFLSIISPFIYGSFIAFLVNPIVRWFEHRALSIFKFKQKTKHLIAVLFTLVVVIEVVVLFVSVLLPQFISSISNISNSLPNYLDSFNQYIAPNIQNYIPDQSVIINLFSQSSNFVQRVIELLQQYVPNIVDFSINVSKSIFNGVLTIVIAIYILSDEEGFAYQLQRFVSAYFGKSVGKNIDAIVSLTSFMIRRFILGKAFNSLVLGIGMYITMLVINIPYPVFLSTIFAVTNMIPFFGPFIGGAFGVIILLLEDPMYAFWFLLAVLILQQIEGSILSPLVIGDSMGLPGIWVFFAIIVGGGYFGVAGMFLGIPVFAVIYLLIQRSMDIRLAQQEAQTESPKDS
jgi:predicted PurR-regulated permease PerM